MTAFSALLTGYYNIPSIQKPLKSSHIKACSVFIHLR
nr:MAG TPA: hypothetical protein [Bacteriophage sp.]